MAAAITGGARSHDAGLGEDARPAVVTAGEGDGVLVRGREARSGGIAESVHQGERWAEGGGQTGSSRACGYGVWAYLIVVGQMEVATEPALDLRVGADGVDVALGGNGVVVVEPAAAVNDVALLQWTGSDAGLGKGGRAGLQTYHQSMPLKRCSS